VMLEVVEYGYVLLLSFAPRKRMPCLHEACIFALIETPVMLTREMRWGASSIARDMYSVVNHLSNSKANTKRHDIDVVV
jgi:hypothetical protein